MESDGNISDDELDPNDYLIDPNGSKSASKRPPTLEEYVKKHVLSPSELYIAHFCILQSWDNNKKH